MRQSFLQLAPEYRDYIWGGSRLRPGVFPTAEAWIVYEQDRIVNGPLAGKTLLEAVEEDALGILGTSVLAQAGEEARLRFPLLIKLLDCRDWLSLQVHPNDRQAVEIEGPGQFGKTEAWHVLEAEPAAKLVAGLKPGTTLAALEQAIQQEKVVDLVHYQEVHPGDTVFMPPGTIHALGPGLLIYEVQETSDWTYRVWDWGRPPSEKRPLHIAKSLAVADPAAAVQAEPAQSLAPWFSIRDGSVRVLATCEYFRLELLELGGQPLWQDTRLETFHALTLIEGEASIQSDHEQLVLQPFQTVLVPARQGRYFLSAKTARLLKSSV